MGTQGPGRRRLASRTRLTAEDTALNHIARQAEARLAAKRAARAEAREIRMRELERQQKEIYQVQKKYYGLDNKWGDIEQWMEDSEQYSRPSRRTASVSDDDDRLSVGSRGSLRLDPNTAESHSGAGCSHSHTTKKKKKKHSKSGNLNSSDVYGSLPSPRLQSSAYNGSRASVFEDSMYSGSRSFSVSSSHAPSEYAGLLGSSSRASSRASSARASPVEKETSSSVASFLPSAAGSSSFLPDLDDITIPDLVDVEERPDRDFLEKGSRTVSTLSAATLASLGGSSSRRGSGDTSISVDTETSIREIKEIHQLKDEIQDVEAKYIQNLKDVKDSLVEVEEKYRKAMMSNAHLDNEKSNLIYYVDTLKDSLMELEEQLSESRRQYDDKDKELEREKQAHKVVQFQLIEMKEKLKQSDELLCEIRQLNTKQDGFLREISDLKETLEWKEKKIGALERQKEYTDAIRNERDELRDEVVQLKDLLKKHGIVPGYEMASNGEKGDVLSDSATCVDAVSQSQASKHMSVESSTILEIRLRKLVDERENLLEQVKRLKAQLEQSVKKTAEEGESFQEEPAVNGNDQTNPGLQRDANRQISDLKFKLAKSEQEVTAMEQNVVRLEGQVGRYRSAAENAEKVEDELKAEKRKLQRELRASLDKIKELEASNNHLSKRIEKMKSSRSTVLN